MRRPESARVFLFKGGASLKKCWFGDNRFSEDPDFSGTKDVPVGAAMEDAVREACQAATRLPDEYAPVEIVCQRYTEKDPHRGGQEAFTIRARFPWQSEAHMRVMVEVSLDGAVLEPAPKRAISHGTGKRYHRTLQDITGLQRSTGDRYSEHDEDSSIRRRFYADAGIPFPFNPSDRRHYVDWEPARARTAPRDAGCILLEPVPR